MFRLIAEPPYTTVADQTVREGQRALDLVQGHVLKAFPGMKFESRFLWQCDQAKRPYCGSEVAWHVDVNGQAASVRSDGSIHIRFPQYLALPTEDLGRFEYPTASELMAQDARLRGYPKEVVERLLSRICEDAPAAWDREQSRFVETDSGFSIHLETLHHYLDDPESLVALFKEMEQAAANAQLEEIGHAQHLHRWLLVRVDDNAGASPVNSVAVVHCRYRAPKSLGDSIFRQLLQMASIWPDVHVTVERIDGWFWSRFAVKLSGSDGRRLDHVKNRLDHNFSLDPRARGRSPLE